jgi:hypothetical protein
MTTGEPGARVVAYAVVRGDDPRVWIADDEFVLTRVVAHQLVATTDPRTLPAAHLAAIRESLLSERWDEAIFRWMEATGEVLDAYPSEQVWTLAATGDDDDTSFEVRMSPIFDDTGAADPDADSP